MPVGSKHLNPAAMESIAAALRKGGPMELAYNYYDKAINAALEAHRADTKRITIRVQRRSSEEYIVQNILSLRTPTVTITEATYDIVPQYIVGDFAYWPSRRIISSCKIADDVCITVYQDSHGWPEEIDAQILQYLQQYLPIQPYLSLRPTPRSNSGDITLFPAQFPYCSPIIMDKAFLITYAHHVPDDGQLKVARVSDAAVKWLGDLRDNRNLAFNPKLENIPIEDIADIMAVLDELGIQS